MRARPILAGIALTKLVVAGLLTRSILRRRRAVEELVAPDLRSPMLYLPTPVPNATVLRLVRRIPLGSVLPLPAGVTTKVRTAYVRGREPVAVHLYEPENRTGPTGVLYWIHGGGYLFGTPEMVQPFAGRVATELGVLVAAVDYRLAPENPFPTPLEDCYTGLRWLHDNAERLGIDPQRIAVGGDSAGGGLAAALVQLAHDRGEVPVRHQMLVYPMLDDRTCLRSDHGDTGRVGWDPTSNRFGWTSYLGRAPIGGLAPEYAVAARRTNLAGLPPAWIGVGSIDLFHDEDVEYAERLRAAGVDVELHVVPGMPHGADVAMPDAPSMKAFTDAKVDALRRVLTA
ncbi:alpha/beta hydrolase fold domain-containing protein [Nostocoides sp. F2B08]|nr:alpha/beta hydrolase fold domain-containing protein [Tetrasphaera sp. F2B08]